MTGNQILRLRVTENHTGSQEVRCGSLADKWNLISVALVRGVGPSNTKNENEFSITYKIQAPRIN
ncbi:hypothetical protein D915_010974, partial [Fasciola hepatica]